jgi:hypothetical protein
MKTLAREWLILMACWLVATVAMTDKTGQGAEVVFAAVVLGAMIAPFLYGAVGVARLTWWALRTAFWS